jgi:hypothetical protein
MVEYVVPFDGSTLLVSVVNAKMRALGLLSPMYVVTRCGLSTAL